MQITFSMQIVPPNAIKSDPMRLIQGSPFITCGEEHDVWVINIPDSYL
jgi:hypothetical protein